MISKLLFDVGNNDVNVGGKDLCCKNKITRYYPLKAALTFTGNTESVEGTFIRDGMIDTIQGS